jgi:DNA-binding CsgD family transcriptional regulator/PAS domain-containing protein
VLDNDLIDRIYHSAVDPSAWRGVVRDLCGVLGAHSGVLALSDNEIELSSVSIAHGVFEDAAVVGEYFAHFGAMDPAVPAFSRNTTGKVAATSRLFAQRDLARDEFYNDFFSRMGLIDSIGTNVLRDERGIALLCFQHAKGAGNFQAVDIAEAERVAPHVRRALQLHRVFAPHRRASGALVDVLEKVTAGVLLLDRAGRPWYVNASAREIFGRADGLGLSSAGGLLTLDRFASDRIAGLIGAVLTRGAQHPGGRATAPRRHGGAPYGVLISPSSPEALSVFEAPGGTGAMILISDPDRFRPTALAAAMAPYGLTRAELGLLASLVAGRSVRDHCDSARISVNTGKFHLRSLFAKTGTHRQAELVRMALTAARDA